MTTFTAEVLAGFNAQAKKELLASNTYLNASFWFTQRSFDGIAGMLRKESDSERAHALEIFDYIHIRSGGCGFVPDLEAPANTWDTPQDVFNDMLNMENENTKSILELMTLVKEKQDHGAEIFLHKFLQEQELSVSEWETLVAKMDSYAALPGLLWHLDKEL